MRCVFVLLSGLALGLVAGAARAQTETPAESPISVTREDGAESCPDAEALTLHVARVRGQETTAPASPAYRVRFTYRAGVFRADIHVDGSNAVRVLRDRRGTCTSLEQATALTLALMMDSDAREPGEHQEAVEPLEEPSKPAAPEKHAARAIPPESGSRAALSFSMGGGALLGVVSSATPALVGDVGISVARFRTSLGVLWLPSTSLDFGPGSLQQSLFSGVARSCLAAVASSDVRLELCSGIYAGLVHVSAEGYTRNDTANKAWLALPLQVAFTTSSQPIGVELGASALVPLRRSDFAIDNLGVAYKSWPVGWLLTMRAVSSWML